MTLVTARTNCESCEGADIEELRSYGDGDIDRVREVPGGYGLQVTSALPGSRRIKATAPRRS